MPEDSVVLGVIPLQVKKPVELGKAYAFRSFDASLGLCDKDDPQQVIAFIEAPWETPIRALLDGGYEPFGQCDIIDGDMVWVTIRMIRL